MSASSHPFLDASADLPTLQLLLVDADKAVRGQTQAMLEAWGHQVFIGSSANELERGLGRSGSPRTDLLLIDPTEPGGGGWLALRRQRQASRSLPIIAMLVGDDAYDRVLALESGADAVIAKPLDARELRARMGSLLVRDTGGSGALQFGRWRLDGTTRRLHGPGAFCTSLSVAEYRLLRAFLERPKSVLLRDQLFELVGAADEEGKGGDPKEQSRRVDLVISRLRHKLDDDARGPRLIHTVRGVGYLFDTGALGQPGTSRNAAD